MAPFVSYLDLHIYHPKLLLKENSTWQANYVHPDHLQLKGVLFLWLILCVNQLSRAGGGAGGVCLFKVRGDKAFTTMLMLGRNSASYCTHKAATAASFATPFGGYSPFNRGSMHCFTLSSVNLGVAHVTRLCCPLGIVWSTGFLPVRSSKRTTPKLYTSLFWVS